MATTHKSINFSFIQTVTRPTAEQKAEVLTKYQSGYLALSEEQKVKEYAINLAHMQTLASLESKSGPERAAYFKSNSAPTDARYAGQLETVLTAEQFTRYEARQAQLKKETKAKLEKQRKEKTAPAHKPLPSGK